MPPLVAAASVAPPETPAVGGTVSLHADVAVVGAGPVGCAAALAMARRGARVILLEGNPDGTAHRLSGELLHPSGVQMLQALGADPTPLARDYPNGEGFTFFPGAGSRPVTLSYDRGARGLSCDHSELVGFLRQAAAAHGRIDYLPGTRGLRLGGGRLLCRRGDESFEVHARRLIAATGRSSFLARRRGALRGERPARLLSAMAGLTLEDVELPEEGFGHIFLGGPGPLLLYRIGQGRARLCCDFPPAAWKARHDHHAFLWESYNGALPSPLRASFAAALRRDHLMCSANYYVPRTHYGWDEVVLVGDATGQAHPLTATGITLGLGDVACLLEARSLPQYRRRRLATTFVPEIVATGLYKVMTGTDPLSGGLRQAIFQVWRRGPESRDRTMRLLALEDTHLVRFCRLYLELMITGAAVSLRRSASRSASGVRWPGRLLALAAALPAWLLAPAAVAWRRRGILWRQPWKRARA